MRRTMSSTTMNLKKLIAALGATCLALASIAAAETIVITNGKLHLTGSAGTIENGGLVITDGRITSVGRNIAIPQDARVIDAQGAPITPGFFAVLSGLGLEEISLNDEANNTGVQDDFPISAALDARDALNPDSSIIPISRAGGVTRAYVTTGPSGKLLGGCGAIISLSGRADPVTTGCAGQMVAMGYSGARRTGDNKAAAFATLRLYIEEASRYARNPTAYRDGGSDTGLTYADLAAFAPAAKGDMPMLIEVESAPDIRRLIKLKEQFGLDLILVSAREAWRVGKELAAADIPVILNPMDNLPQRFEAMGATLENAARLHEAGVTIAFFDSDIGYTHNVRLLPQLAGNAVANGLPYDAALAAISTGPAKIWSLDQQLGSLTAGKLADIVIWDGDPLELSSRPVAIFINGEQMSLDNRQSKLADRYKDLTRGDLPPAYKGR